MPNIVVDENGNTSIYISSFISYSSTGGSKVGAMVYVNQTPNLTGWIRPNANLYWYKASGRTPDEKFVDTQVPGSIPTNIVGIDIESVGLFEEKLNGETVLNWVYLPQRQSKGDLLASYKMSKTFTDKGVLQGFSQMKQDRVSKQSLFHFRYLNGGTQLKMYKHDGKYYVNARLNTKRSELRPGEQLPFRPSDPRKRFRRELVSEIGPQVKTTNLEYEVALDMSDIFWEPYSLQSFRLPGFESDIHWGIVTMYGTDNIPNVEMKQRTELAFSVDGKHWKYLKPGEPFLDNGTDPNSDDFGCINMGKPTMGTKFFSDPNKLLYFYASSNHRHVITRQTGISLATGDFAKLAGLKSQQPKSFMSVNPKSSIIDVSDMVTLYPGKVFELGKTHYPYVLADITQDPSGKKVTELDSYVEVCLYAYDPSVATGKGKKLIGVLGSSIKGTKTPSSNYECVGEITDGKDMTDKERILEYIRDYSQKHPAEIVNFNTMAAIPILFESTVKNATFYGIEFKNSSETNDMAVDFTNPSKLSTPNLWEYHPAVLVPGACQSFDFSNSEYLPNINTPVDLRRGAFAIKVNPAVSTTDQVILKMSGDDYNNLSVSYLKNGSLQFLIMKDSIPYNKLEIAPPSGKTFVGKSVLITIEGQPQRFRKYLTGFKEDAAVMRVKVDQLGFEKVINEPLLWNWNHNPGEITSGDSTVARTAGYVPFTSFVAGMTTINVGGNSSFCDKNFKGTIEQIEVSNGLPTGVSDFWITPSLRTKSTDILDNGIEDKQLIYLSPNPVRRGDILKCNINSTDEQIFKIDVISMSGSIMETYNRKIYGESTIDIDTSNLSSGIYLVTFRSNTISTTRKIIVI